MTAGDLFQRLIPILDGAGVEYMVTGSLASSVHGTPRSTQDIDLVIDADRAGVLSLVQGLADDQYYVSEESALRALSQGGQFNVIDYQTGWKIDFIFRKQRDFSSGEFARRSLEVVDGTPLFLVSAEDSLLSKLEWAKAGGSDRQLNDAAGIIRTQGDDLDWAYLGHWARRLDVEEQLQSSRARAAADPTP